MAARTAPRTSSWRVPSSSARGAPDLRLIAVAHGGKGAAVRAGMLDATTDLVVFADADMATPPDQLPLIVDALAGADVALGSRIQTDGSDMRKSQPWYRRMLGKAFHLLASIWVVGPVKDTQCGFKGFTREAARDLFSHQRIQSIVFDVELIYLARRRGYRMASCRSAGPTGADPGCGPVRASPSASPGTCSGSRCSIAAFATREPRFRRPARNRRRLNRNGSSG